MVHKHDIVVSYRNIPIAGWFIMEFHGNSDLEMDASGVPPFKETSK